MAIQQQLRDEWRQVSAGYQFHSGHAEVHALLKQQGYQVNVSVE